ncbi:MAG: hypothetical protein JXB39_15690 [Deltaproteobacteria bacterium]|nr:hypothetical protein [Deltaproteobacteria bacterium]
MELQEIALIEGFLGETSATNLLDYHGVAPDASDAEVEARIKEKRAWAQTQQANPKYRSAAMWIIKNQALIRRALLEEREAYLASVAAGELQSKIDMLDLLVEGSSLHGQVSVKAREAIRRRALDMGLSEEETDRYLRDRLTSVLAQDEEGPSSDWDPYEVLGIRRDADIEVIEQAYRSRYRWARSLRDLDRAKTVYQELDRAWRDLSTPERRAAIDAGLDPDGSVIRVHRSSARTTLPPVDPNPSPVRASHPVGADTGEARAQNFRFSTPVTDTHPPFSESQSSSVGARFPLREASTPLTRERASPARPSLLPPTPPPAGGPDDEDVLTARLNVDAQPTIEMVTWFRPGRTTFHVSNEGGGPMPGTLTSSQPWLTVQPRTLDPYARETEVEVTFWPRRVPARVGTARLSVTTAHGQRRVITVKVRKRPLILPILGIAGALLVLVLLVRSGALPFLSGSDTGPIRTRLVLTVTPTADGIFLDDARVGAGRQLELSNPAPPGRRVQLRIERRGCLAHEEALVFGDGQRLDVSVTLQPDPDVPGGCS